MWLYGIHWFPLQPFEFPLYIMKVFLLLWNCTWWNWLYNGSHNSNFGAGMTEDSMKMLLFLWRFWLNLKMSIHVMYLDSHNICITGMILKLWESVHVHDGIYFMNMWLISMEYLGNLSFIHCWVWLWVDAFFGFMLSNEFLVVFSFYF